MADDDAAAVLLLRPPPLQPPPLPLLLLLLACCCWPAVAGLLLLAYCCWPAAAAGVLLLTCCCWPATDAPLLLQAPSHRYRQCTTAPEAAGRRGGRAASTFAVGVLHDVETRRASRGGRARRRRRPRPQPLQLPLPKKLSLPSCTTGPGVAVEPWLSVCRALSGSVGALSGLCRDSVGTLSVDNCRASVGLCRPLSASVGLCRPLSTDPDRYYVCTVSTSVGLSRLCQSVGLSVCRPLSVSVEASVVILSGPLS